MPTTQPAPAVGVAGIEQRLEDNGIAWLGANAFLGQFTLRERLADGTLKPATNPNAPILILEARDRGRAVKNAPIRNVDLHIHVRTNTKATTAAAFAGIGGALEILLDTTNLVQALSGPLVAVMLATRVPGLQLRTSEFKREGTVTIECRCVAAELTTQGSGVMPPAGS